jgi:DNA-binding CsgD family transcriptional regulator
MEQAGFGEITCHLCFLLRCAEEHQTTRTATLARITNLREETVDSYWKEIKRIFQTQERHQAVLLAKQHGYLDGVPAKRNGGGQKNFK